MARCPKCGASIGMRAVACPRCGHDFPDPPPPPETMSPLQIAFIVFSSLGSIATGVFAVWRFWWG